MNAWTYFLYLILLIPSLILSEEAKNELDNMCLNAYLRQYGFYLSPNSYTNEKYCTESQREKFKDTLRTLATIKQIAQIGFNGGHSCETFLESLPDCCVTAFEQNSYPYTTLCVDFMKRKYCDRFEFIEGNSMLTIPLYVEKQSEKKFDLIFIDGNLSRESCISKICKCQSLANKNTMIWINDYPSNYQVKSAVDHLIQQNILEILSLKSICDHTGIRNWGEFVYQYQSEEERIFNRIYQQGLWGRNSDGQPNSGPGSTLPQGQPFVDFVQNFLHTHDIRTVVDLGCGDWTLGKEIDWGSSQYIGLDIVKSIIIKNQEKFSSPTVSFFHANVVTDPLPEGDLLICKDVLIHLPLAEISKILDKLKNYKYLIFVNDYDHRGMTNNREIQTGDFRSLDLTKWPFSLCPEQSETYVSGYVTKQILLISN